MNEKINKLTIVTATMLRPSLRRTIASVCEAFADYPHEHLIICDQNVSKDHTHVIELQDYEANHVSAGGDFSIEVVDLPGIYTGNQKQAVGLMLAQGDVVFNLDDDCWIENPMMARHVVDNFQQCRGFWSAWMRSLWTDQCEGERMMRLGSDRTWSVGEGVSMGYRGGSQRPEPFIDMNCMLYKKRVAREAAAQLILEEDNYFADRSIYRNLRGRYGRPLIYHNNIDVIAYTVPAKDLSMVKEGLKLQNEVMQNDLESGSEKKLQK